MKTEYKMVEKKSDLIITAINKAISKVFRLSNILFNIIHLLVNIIAVATAHGSSSESDK